MNLFELLITGQCVPLTTVGRKRVEEILSTEIPTFWSVTALYANGTMEIESQDRIHTCNIIMDNSIGWNVLDVINAKQDVSDDMKTSQFGGALAMKHYLNKDGHTLRGLVKVAVSSLAVHHRYVLAWDSGTEDEYLAQVFHFMCKFVGSGNDATRKWMQNRGLWQQWRDYALHRSMMRLFMAQRNTIRVINKDFSLKDFVTRK